MTLVVGFNFGPYALVAADTRVSYYPPSGPRFEDDHRKIVRTSLGGLATGAGMVALLDPVKARLTGDVAFVDDILRAIAETRDAVEARHPNPDPRVADALDTTAWMFTYVTAIDGAPKLRLGVAGSARDAEAENVPEGTFRLFPPTGVSEEQERAWWEFVRDELRPFVPQTDDFAQHLGHHVSVARELITQVAAVNDGVAPTFQFAVHVLPYAVGVSSIIGDGSDFELDWGGSFAAGIAPDPTEAGS
jgi:hypothetical protein